MFSVEGLSYHHRKKIIVGASIGAGAALALDGLVNKHQNGAGISRRDIINSFVGLMTNAAVSYTLANYLIKESNPKDKAF